MAEFYRIFIPCVWLAWIVIWWLFAFNVKSTVQRQPPLARLLDLALLFAAGALLWHWSAPVSWLTERFLPPSQWRFWVSLGAVLTLGGLLFTVWARVHLGRNWSGTVTIKADHELVTNGPYRLVRHPIYSGMALAFIGTALAVGQWRAVLAVALAFICFLRRVVVEERFMRQQFGGVYDDYARRVRALVPFVF